MKRGRWLLLIAISAPLSFCAGDGPPQLQGDRLTALSEEELEDLSSWVATQAETRSRLGAGCGGAADLEASPSQATAQASPSITNNQEEGVDEGGIVKAYRSYLVVLRRGRLFTIRVANDASPTLEPAHAAESYAALKPGSWYDELLIHGDRAVVVGYSYRTSATEIGLFRLGEDGSIQHQQTFFLSSNDYYSARNYASRLVAGTLVFYMPYYLGSARHPLPSYWLEGQEAVPILRAAQVYRPLQPGTMDALHTIVRCQLDTEPLACTATAVIGSYVRSYYVAQDAVYLWSGGSAAVGALPQSLLHRLPLDGGRPTAVRVTTAAAPLDQFSFSLQKGALHVALVNGATGDAMWMAEGASGAPALLRVPLSDFTPEGTLHGSNLRSLPAAIGYPLHNRFVGEHLLYGAGSVHSTGGSQSRTLTAVPLDGTALASLQLPHAIDRIEPLGKSGALIVGDELGGSLQMSTVELGATPRLVSGHLEPNLTQGESRSHGFFFSARSDGSGIFGLPLRNNGSDAWHGSLHMGSVRVAYFELARDLILRPVGTLAASAVSTTNDQCKASCADWYGNARPIFLGPRLLALLGYELVEGELRNGGVAEQRRISFAP